MLGAIAGDTIGSVHEFQGSPARGLADLVPDLP